MYPEQFLKAAEFHGHVCPGLAIGYRVADAALAELGSRAEDEERVCEVQNDSCAVDAVQFMVGCTFGKGNLVFKDYGKQVYYFWTRDREGPALRVALREDNRGGPGSRSELSEQEWEAYRRERIQWILTAPLEDVLDIRREERPAPPRAKIRDSEICAFCGEKVMATRTRELDGNTACIPCREARSRS